MLPLKYFSLFSRYKIGIVMDFGCSESDVWYSKMDFFLLDGKAFELVVVKHKGLSSNVCMFCFLFVFFRVV